ncbi:hypothetical protein AAG570_005148 [Ranatra chinensis]|uniref:Reverse transcriptase n=1 Tax=Ranatra chinensis TaxID=642074 RepID=A0ABD0XZM2_9HEMI
MGKRDITLKNLVVRSLDYEVGQRVADTVQFPGDQPYVAIKSALIESYSLSGPDRAQQLLRQQTLGGRKSSQLLAHLRRPGGNALPLYLLRALWMWALPTSVRDILALAPNTDLQTLATQADQVTEEVCPVVENVQPGEPRKDLYEEVKSLRQQLLEFKVSASHHPPSHPQPRAQQRPRSRPHTVDEKPASGACFYHRKLGDKARRCQPPCTNNSLAGNGTRPHNQLPVPSTVGTGASVSVVPVSRKQGLQRDLYTLHAANGSPIGTYGQVRRQLDLGLGKLLEWTFTIADVHRPIIGADFLFHHGLLVDIRRHRLVDRLPKRPFCQVAEGTPTVYTVPAGSPYAELLQQFPDITCPGNLHREVRHLVRHHIETTGPPVVSRARRLTPHLYKAAKEDFQRLIAEGTCRPSSSPWASPLHMVPNVLDFNINVHSATVFSTIDVERAYYQIPVAPEDVQKTAVISPFGLFEFTRMSFGLRNAAQTFQRFIDSIFRDLSYVFPYIDDLLTASRSPEEHRRHLQEVFSCLDRYGIRINRDKSDTLRHLTDLLPAKPKKNDRFPLKWTPEANLSFATCKEALRNATRLGHPNMEADLSLHCGRVGPQQLTKGAWEPLGLFSRSLSRTERQYSTYDRELLVIYLAARYIRPLLEGRQIQTHTDHKPLTFAFRQPHLNAPPRRTRQLTYISQFTTGIRFLVGSDNPVADTLSRIEELGLPNALDTITQAQKFEERTVTRLLREHDKLKWLYLSGVN